MGKYLREITPRTALTSFFLLILMPSVWGGPSGWRFRTLIFKNLITITTNLHDVVFTTIREFKSKQLQGYNDKDNVFINYKNIYKQNLTEKERFIDQLNTLYGFLVPLREAFKELRRVKAKHAFKDVKLIRYKTVDIMLSIVYVGNHLGYSIPKFNNVAAKQYKDLLFPKKTTRSLGNRIVSLLASLEEQLSRIHYYYSERIQEQRMIVRK